MIDIHANKNMVYQRTLNSTSSNSIETHTSSSSFRWSSESARQMADCIHNEVKQMVGSSRLTRQSPNSIALVCRGDLEIGALLGKGAFSEVHEVRIRGNSNSGSSCCSSQQPQRFAMKHLKYKLMCQPENFRLAAAELAVEAHMLASFNHPNILRIRGWAANGVASFVEGRHDSFFLLLDCLDETLEQRISQWKATEEGLRRRQQQTAFSSLYPANFVDVLRRLSAISTLTQSESGLSAEYHQLYLEKYQVCAEIASALAYLHECCGVIFRDLKPNNIGILNGRVQLFDFGLSRELPACDLSQPFEMSGKVGTLRYMAVEVASHLPYNVSADVYSWAMVCYEIWTGNKPFQGWTREMHADLTCAQGMRPEITSQVPLPMKPLLLAGWDQNPHARPTMTTLYSQVRQLQEEQTQLLACCIQQQLRHAQQRHQQHNYKLQQQLLLQHNYQPQQLQQTFQPEHQLQNDYQPRQMHSYPSHNMEYSAAPGFMVELPEDFVLAQKSSSPRDIYTAATLSLSNDFSLNELP